MSDQRFNMLQSNELSRMQRATAAPEREPLRCRNKLPGLVLAEWHVRRLSAQPLAQGGTYLAR